MENIVKNGFWIQPKPKYLNINLNESGITLSSLLTLYINKYRIKDNVLLLSSKFNKHFNTFLNSIPIRDSTLDEKLGENFYFTIITTESKYESQIKSVINGELQNNIAKFESKLNDCCYNLYPNELKSNLPLDESYYINLSKGMIWVISSTTRGFYYGIQTLVQIIEHTLFQLDKIEEYITLPKLTVVDFPGQKYRGVSIDLKKKKPDIENLTSLISFLGKYKINHIWFTNSVERLESNEVRKKLIDLCDFHKVIPKFPKESEMQVQEKPTLVKIIGDHKYNIPKYRHIINEITEKSNKNGILIKTSEEWEYSQDLFLLGVPMFSEPLWNPSPTSTEKWIYSIQSLMMNLFENKVTEQEQDFLKIFEIPSNNDDITQFVLLLDSFSKKAYENGHLLTTLKNVFVEHLNI